ncbi:GTP-binding protein, partial [Staphylococcus equorum]
LQTELMSTIQQLVEHNQVEHIVIEATGIANPIDMMVACEDPKLIQIVQTPEIITIVAAPDIISFDTLSASKRQLLEDQMRASNHIIVNKTDLL